MDLSMKEIVVRLVIAILFSGVIGFEREYKSRPAGIRTHILVCVGSALLALIQRQIEVEVIQLITTSPELASVVRVDPARLICQIVSGIGFLGAGTIIVTRRSVMGLTTAASLWAIAGLGIAVGMGYYAIATAGFIATITVLMLMQKLMHLPDLKRLEIQYSNPAETKQFIVSYFEANKIDVKDVDYGVDFSREKHTYTNIYTLAFPKNMDQSGIMEDLAECKEIFRIRAINI